MSKYFFTKPGRPLRDRITPAAGYWMSDNYHDVVNFILETKNL